MGTPAALAVAERATLLVVEDDVGIATLERRRLERAGYAVVTAADAAAARERVGQGGIDLIILQAPVAPVSASPPARPSIGGRRSCCATPTWRWTGPSRPARRASSCSTPGSTPRPRGGWTWRPNRASLSYLKRCPVDLRKVDRAFVAGLGIDGEDTAIVQAIITLAHTLGLQVVAEGIETATHLKQLQALGCEFGQGYYVAKPLPADLATSMLGGGL